METFVMERRGDCFLVVQLPLESCVISIIMCCTTMRNIVCKISNRRFGCILNGSLCHFIVVCYWSWIVIGCIITDCTDIVTHTLVNKLRTQLRILKSRVIFRWGSTHLMGEGWFLSFLTWTENRIVVCFLNRIENVDIKERRFLCLWLFWKIPSVRKKFQYILCEMNKPTKTEVWNKRRNLLTKRIVVEKTFLIVETIYTISLCVVSRQPTW